MATSGVYQIRNNINGKIYVGSAKNIRTRWNSHRTTLNCGKHVNQYLQRAWYKYGPDSFSFSVLELVTDTDKLVEREQHYLDTLKSWDRSTGYNILPTAYSPKGREVSEETKKKLSLANKGKTLSEEHKAKLSAAHTGKTLSEDHKAKIGKSGKGKKLSPEAKRRLSLAHRGRKPSEETRKKLSAINTGKTIPEETRKKISSGLKGIKRSEETRKKMGEAAMRRQARYTPEQVADMRFMKSQGISYREIGKKYGCGVPSARAIILGHLKSYPLDPRQKIKFQNAPNKKKARFSEAEIKEMLRLRKSGWSYPQIAKLIGCSKDSVQQILSGKWSKYNLEEIDASASTMTGRILKFTLADAGHMRQMRRDGITYAEIAKLFATTAGTVRDIVTGKIKAYPLASNDADFKRQPKTSIEDIQRMKELHDEGMQYKQIATLFGCSDGHVRALLQGKYKRKRVA